MNAFAAISYFELISADLSRMMNFNMIVRILSENRRDSLRKINQILKFKIEKYLQRSTQQTSQTRYFKLFKACKR